MNKIAYISGYMSKSAASQPAIDPAVLDRAFTFTSGNEGWRDKPYTDPATGKTIQAIGYGWTDPGILKQYPTMTREQGNIMLRQDLSKYWNTLNGINPRFSTWDPGAQVAMLDWYHQTGGKGFPRMMDAFKSDRRDDVWQEQRFDPSKNPWGVIARNDRRLDMMPHTPPKYLEPAKVRPVQATTAPPVAAGIPKKSSRAAMRAAATGMKDFEPFARNLVQEADPDSDVKLAKLLADMTRDVADMNAEKEARKWGDGFVARHGGKGKDFVDYTLPPEKD